MKLIYDIIPSLKEIKNGKTFKLKRIIDLRKTVISKDKTQNKIKMLNRVINVKYQQPYNPLESIKITK